MGSSFVSIDGEHGFWMGDSELSLFLRLLALHIPEPDNNDSPAKHSIVKRIRDQWLLASKIDFGGCVPDGLDDAFATDDGRAAVIAATDSLMNALKGVAHVIDRDALNLLGMEGGPWHHHFPTSSLIKTAHAFHDLYAGRVRTTASDSTFVPAAG
jgi:hypothetical protein